nr:MBL fold metallo-hydrolase [uncultured Desulfobacter sp.]
MDNWFTIDQIDKKTYIISEYRHWEETHCYLLNGSKFSLLIDTGLGICDIHNEVKKLTDNPIIAVATHIHWDHIGGHKFFPNFYAHQAELNWLDGEFPLTIDQIKEKSVYAKKLLIALRAVRHPLRATFNFIELSNED